MIKTSKKLMIIAIAIVLVIAMVPMGVLAETAEAVTTNTPVFDDMPNDWSTTALKNAVHNGLLKGANGKINARDNLRRAEMATIINRAFGTTVEASLEGYTDVSKNAWYYSEMKKAMQMKTFKGSGDNKLKPLDSITRQEAFLVVARAFKLGQSDDVPQGFSDLGNIASWAKGEVYALINAGYIQGSDGKINPTGLITRAEFAKMMDNILTTYIQEAGVYETVAAGNVMINVPGVTLKDLTVKGDLIIGDGVGDGDFTLDNVIVEGRTVVRGGGENSIVIKNGSQLGNLIITRVDGAVRVVTEDGSTVEALFIDDGKDGVIIEGQVDSIDVQTGDVEVVLKNAKVKTITVSSANANVSVGEGSNVDNLVVNAPNTTVSGEGNVTNADVKAGANNSKIATPNTTINVGEGVTGTKGKDDADVEAGGSHVNDGPVVAPPITPPVVVPVSAISVDKEATTLPVGTSETLVVTFDPTNATYKNVTWSSSDEGVATVADGVVTAVTEGTATITATSNNGKTATTTVTVVHEDTVAMIGTTQYDSLREAVNVANDSKAEVIMIADVTIAGGSGGYGVAGLVLNGAIINGNGNTLTVTDANNTWDAAIYTTGGTIKNLNIGGAFRGILTAGASEDIIIDNVVIDNVCYTFHSDGANPNYSVIVTNSTLNGWTSYNGSYKSVSFTNSKFGKGTGAYQYAFMRPYSDTEINNSEFSEGYKLDATMTDDITLYNSTVGGVKLTQDNLTTLLGASAAKAKVLTIEDDVYYYGTTLYGLTNEFTGTTLTVREGTTALANGAFAEAGVTEVTIPAAVTDFGATGVSETGASGGAFKGSAVTTVVLEEGMIEIPAAAFNGATELTSVNIPASVKTIGINAFRQTALTELTIPETVTTIKNGAFRDMTSLETVTVEGNVNFENYAFRSVPKLTSIYLLGDDVTFNGSQFSTHFDNGDATGITIYVKNATVAARVYAAQSSAYGYEVKILGDKADGSDASIETIAADVDYAAVWNKDRETFYIEVSVPDELLDAASIKSISTIKEAGVEIAEPVALTPDTDKVLWFGVAGKDGLVDDKDAGEYAYKVIRQDGSEYIFNFTYNPESVTGGNPETVEPTIGFVVDESNRVIWVYDFVGLFEAQALINEDDSNNEWYIILMDNIDLGGGGISL